MKEEILAAVMFLVRFIEKSETFPRDQLENFKNNLTTLLTQRFEKHWFPEVPAKGQGYRCIRVNGLSPVDMTLERAAVLCGLSYRDLRLPTELTVWVDPNEVCYRLGESEGSYCTLATFVSDSPGSSPTTSPLTEKLRKPPRNHHRTSAAAAAAAAAVAASYHQHQHHQHQQRTGGAPYNAGGAAVHHMSGLKMRQMGFNLTPSRPQWRCDRQSFPMPPSAYHWGGGGNRYMQRNYKNVLTV